MDCAPPFNLTEEILDLCIGIAEKLGRIADKKILEKLPKLKEASLAQAIYSTLALEGNCLSYEQVFAIGNGEHVLGAAKEIREVKDAYKVYKELPALAWDNIADFLKSYKKITGLSNKQYEQALATNMFDSATQLLLWGKDSSAHPLIKSSVFHYRLKYMQLPAKESGKIARLWAAAVLTAWRPILAFIPIESILLNQKAEYCKIKDLAVAEGSLNPFIMFMLQAILNAVEQLATDIDNHLLNTSDRVRRLMFAIQEHPMSANELMVLLGLKSKAAFFDNYLHPAMQAGLVAMTLPGKPTSGNQMYYKK